MTNLKLILTFSLILILLGSCKREEATRWNVDLKAPLAHGKLSIGDLVGNEYLQTSSEGLVHFRLDQNLTDFDLEELLEIPDTNFYDFISNDFFTLQIMPGGIVIPPEEGDAEMNIPNVQLKEIISKSGSLQYTLRNFVDGNLLATYGLPKAVKDGESVYIEELLSPGSFENPSEVIGYYDLAGYHFDLSGENGDSFNQMNNAVSLNADPNATSNVTIPIQDTVISTLIGFIDPKVSYARGYFGQHSLEIDDQIELEQLQQIVSGNLNVGEVSLDLVLSNYAGIDVQIQIDNLVGINSNSENEIALENSELQNTINLTRATDNGGTVVPDVYEIHLDNSNSNVDLWLENLPDKLNTQTSIEVNPLGDITSGNDFIYVDQALEARMILDIPLCVSMDDIRLIDFLTLDYSEDIPLTGEIILLIDNAFPMDANLTLKVLNDEGAEVYTLLNEAILGSGLYDSNTNSTASTPTEIRITINEEIQNILRNNNQLLMDVTLNSYNSEEVKFTSDNEIDVEIYLEGELEISYE